MSMTMRNTKSEMLAYIADLEGRLQQGGRDMHALRHKISVLEGAAALRGPIVERHGQRTIKRWPAPVQP